MLVPGAHLLNHDPDSADVPSIVRPDAAGLVPRVELELGEGRDRDAELSAAAAAPET